MAFALAMALRAAAGALARCEEIDACGSREAQRCHLRLVGGRSLHGSAAGPIAGPGATGKHLVDEQEGGSDHAGDDRDPRVHDRLQRDEAGENDNGESHQPPRG